MAYFLPSSNWCFVITCFQDLRVSLTWVTMVDTMPSWLFSNLTCEQVLGKGAVLPAQNSSPVIVHDHGLSPQNSTFMLFLCLCTGPSGHSWEYPGHGPQPGDFSIWNQWQLKAVLGKQRYSMVSVFTFLWDYYWIWRWNWSSEWNIIQQLLPGEYPLWYHKLMWQL